MTLCVSLSILIGGYILSEEELVALEQIHDDTVIEQLMNKGLKLEGNVTIEEVQYYLKLLEMVDEASSLKENLDSFIKSKNYLCVGVRISMCI